jgi:hypothetical protein
MEGSADMTSPACAAPQGQTRLDRRDEELQALFEQQERREMMEKLTLLARAKGQIRQD